MASTSIRRGEADRARPPSFFCACSLCVFVRSRCANGERSNRRALARTATLLDGHHRTRWRTRACRCQRSAHRSCPRWVALDAAACGKGAERFRRVGEWLRTGRRCGRVRHDLSGQWSGAAIAARPLLAARVGVAGALASALMRQRPESISYTATRSMRTPRTELCPSRMSQAGGTLTPRSEVSAPAPEETGCP